MIFQFEPVTCPTNQAAKLLGVGRNLLLSGIKSGWVAGYWTSEKKSKFIVNVQKTREKLEAGAHLRKSKCTK